MKYVTTKIGKFVEKVWLFLYESVYSKETLEYYFDKDCSKCKRPWRFYTLPKGKIPMREFLGARVPMEYQDCPEELVCKAIK